MISSSKSPKPDDDLFDHSKPFRGVVVCCTSISAELRTVIAKKTEELGGVHKYDLTPEVTHLIVGDHDTAKYRHVAKARPDILPMAAGWVEAVRNVWVTDSELNFTALEKEWQLRPFETHGGEPGDVERGRLLCCLTGFEDQEERQHIMAQVQSHGGLYTGDLTRRVTHLIVYKPEGKKFQAAKNWGIKTVSVEWVNDCIERGMILDESCYEPTLQPEQRGRGAWTKEKARSVCLGKRLRDRSAAGRDDSRKKLRRSTSMKLSSQRDNLWGDILGKAQASAEAAPSTTSVPAGAASATLHTSTKSSTGQPVESREPRVISFGTPDQGLVFTSSCFFLHGFPEKQTELLVRTLSDLGGLLCHSLDEAISTSGARVKHRFLLVPQNSKVESHPELPDHVHVVTEFYIERCLHNKTFFDPDSHVIGRPFPVFPIPEFKDIIICTAGFTGLDLNQMDRAVRQVGAKYEEWCRMGVSLLLCASPSAVRKQKLELAMALRIPIISADWLWESIKTGTMAPIETFLFHELEQVAAVYKAGLLQKRRKPHQSSYMDPALTPKPAPSKAKIRDLDQTAFAPATLTSKSVTGAPAASEVESSETANIDTALLQQQCDTPEPNRGLFPLSEISAYSRSRSQTRQASRQPPRKPLSRTASEVADSEAMDSGDDLVLPGHLEDGTRDQEGQDTERMMKRMDKADMAEQRFSARTALQVQLVNLVDPASKGDRTEDGGEASHCCSRPRRKRKVMGRAISNVSAMSSASAASSSHVQAVAGTESQAGSGTVAVPVKLVMSGSGVARPDLASTQLDYEDAETERHKARLMDKMLGGTDGDKMEAEYQESKKLTLGESKPQRSGTGRRLRHR